MTFLFTFHIQTSASCCCNSLIYIPCLSHLSACHAHTQLEQSAASRPLPGDAIVTNVTFVCRSSAHVRLRQRQQPSLSSLRVADKVAATNLHSAATFCAACDALSLLCRAATNPNRNCLNARSTRLCDNFDLPTCNLQLATCAISFYAGTL